MIEHNDPRLRLCVVTDELRDGIQGLTDRVCSAERGGATMVLLRLKHADARTLLEAAHSLIVHVQIPLLVSERLDVAVAAGAAGVHLSPQSMPVVAVRSQLPAGMLVATSVSSVEDLAAIGDADFVTIGPVHGAGDASLGLEGFRQLAALAALPAIAIGGMDAERARDLRAAGARGIAVIGQVMAADDPAAAVAALL